MTDVTEVDEWLSNPVAVVTRSRTYEPVPSVSSNPDRLRELFENLFQNATDHGGDDAAVRVGPLDTGFFVEDDGLRIADRCEEEVFDHGFTTRDGGHGYGLSVIRTIVNAHGWDVVVTEAESGGVRFSSTNQYATTGKWFPTWMFYSRVSW